MRDWWGGGGSRLNILLILMAITAFSLESDKETTAIKAIIFGAYHSAQFYGELRAKKISVENKLL